ncbi:MAG: diacylglycerol/lipid kinase family protein [Anaerolineae bacterium]
MRALVIFNPAAGLREARADLERALPVLSRAGWDVTLEETEGPGEALEMSRGAAARGYEAVVAAGGDGTLNEVLNGIVGSDLLLGVLPLGVGNVWAREIGVPAAMAFAPDLETAAEKLASGRVYRVDVGKANERYFLLWAGVGLDASVVEALDHRLKKRLGPVAFLLAGARALESLSASPVKIMVDGDETSRDVVLVEVSNAQTYASIARLASEACLDDGLLDVTVFRGRGRLDAVRHIGTLLLGRHRRHPQVEELRGREIVITSDRPLSLHLDGEPSGTTPVDISVEPSALRAIIPSDVRSGLFRQPPERERATAVPLRQV